MAFWNVMQGDPVLMEMNHARRGDLMRAQRVFERCATGFADVQEVDVFATAEARDHPLLENSDFSK